MAPFAFSPLRPELAAQIKEGDIIVAAKDSYGNGTPIVKRIIATEGQVVDIDFETGMVTVDGEILNEPYIKSLTKMSEGVVFPLKVEEGCVFVMGDNRMNSKDSRDPVIGLIDEREILGKAIVLFLPGTDAIFLYLLQGLLVDSQRRVDFSLFNIHNILFQWS